ncbi:MAG: MFS transporter, partial [Candidatus Bathyarchaeia archaeon]
VVSFFNLGAWAALYTYTPELYPTEMRGTGTGSAASVGRLAGIAAPALTGYIWSVWGLSMAFLVFAAAHLVNALAVGVWGMETKGKVLEEISTHSS